MPDKCWKSEERHAARLLGGVRYPASSGGRLDVEGPGFVAQVKHRRVCSLAELERLAVELEALGTTRGKLGVVVVKRRAGAGHPTPRLVVCTESVWRDVAARLAAGDSGREPGHDLDVDGSDRPSGFAPRTPGAPGTLEPRRVTGPGFPPVAGLASVRPGAGTR